MMTSFTTKKAISGLFLILFCFAVADYADSKDNPGKAQQVGVPAQIENLAREVGELKGYISDMVSKQSKIYEALEILLPATREECPCWTLDDLSLVGSDEGEYVCLSDLVPAYTGLRSYTNICENDGYLTKGWGDFRIYANEEEGFGCRRSGYFQSGVCVDEPEECENYFNGAGRLRFGFPEAPAYRMTLEQYRACEALLVQRVSELGIYCDITHTP